MKPIELLKSQNAVITVLIVALLAQMPHAEAVFYAHGQSQDWLGRIASIAAAIALELAVLVFVVRGSIRASWGFAAFSVAINLVYYYRADATLFDLAPTILLSAGLPIAIALYSHEVAEPVQPVQAPAQPPPPVVHKEKPVVQPERTMPDPIVQEETGIVQDEIDPRARAAQLKSEGFTNAQISEMMGVHRNTISAYLRQPMHTNGNH